MIRHIKTIDAHTAGEPLRLVVGGCPRARGETMSAKRDWFRKRWDRVRRTIVNEPRGHADMFAAVLTEPVTPGSHAGVLFMHSTGYTEMSGHGVIAVVTIALERSLLNVTVPGAEIVLDTPAGLVRARARWVGDRVDQVSFVNVPSFVANAGLRVRLGGREIPIDVAFGGVFYAVTDSESVGVPVRPAYLSELRKVGSDLRQVVQSIVRPVHPLNPALRGIHGAVITGLPDCDDADLRNVTVFAGTQVNRSVSGTGTSAVMAVADAMGVLQRGRPFVQESLIGTRLTGALVGRTTVGEVPAIITRIQGEAWIIGEHEFVIDDDDPLRDGFVL